ncbi:MAG TPA: hypothetical protein PLS65_12395, partial [Ferruginibacter sp.]|nr:hypothetical protein [Ferruginibacter sp.]
FFGDGLTGQELAGLISEMQDELSRFKTSKGTIRFTVENPLPVSLITRMTRIRVQQNLEKEAAKKQRVRKG